MSSFDRERQRLVDIVANIDSIADYTGSMTVTEFMANGQIIDATERCLQRITEAAIRIGADRMAVIAPDAPLEAVRGLGNVLRHEYDNIDLRTIYRTVRQDLPPMRAAAVRALEN